MATPQFFPPERRKKGCVPLRSTWSEEVEQPPGEEDPDDAERCGDLERVALVLAVGPLAVLDDELGREDEAASDHGTEDGDEREPVGRVRDEGEQSDDGDEAEPLECQLLARTHNNFLQRRECTKHGCVRIIQVL